MPGLSSNGFSIYRLNDVIAKLKANAQTEFASLVAPGDIVNTSDSTVLGRLIKTIAPSIADLWEAGQDVYAAFDINQASDQALENLTMLGGIERSPAIASTVIMLLGGVYGTSIPADSFIKATSTGKVFATDDDVLLDENLCVSIEMYPTTVSNSTVYSFTYQIAGINASPVTVSITSDGSATKSEIVNALITEVNTNHSTDLFAVLNGENIVVSTVNLNVECTYNASAFTIVKAAKAISATCTTTGVNVHIANSISSIQSPVVGWETATNPYEATSGTEIETDAELRTKYITAKFQDSLNTYEAIYSAVLKISGVTEIIIYENETDATLGSPPLPPHSFYVIVRGGNSIDIAQAIWDNKPAGIATYGSVVETVTDSQGVNHTIKFDRPVDVPIYIEVHLTKDSAYPVDGDAQIKTAIIEYISSLNIGDDVLYSRLYSPVNSVPGHYVTALYLDTTASPAATSNIPFDYYKRATITAANIDIV